MRDIFAKDEDLLCGGLLGSGSYGSVFKAYYKIEKMALKKFGDEIVLPNSVSFKLVEMCKDFDKFDDRLVTPKYVFDDKEVKKYLIKFVNGKDLSKLYYLPIEKKIHILKKAKELVCDMNDKGIIHGDLLFANFMYDNKKDDVFIIDFDKSQYGDFGLKNEDYFLTEGYVDENGIDTSLDIFIFNLATFALLNGKNTFSCRYGCLDGCYGCLQDVPNIDRFSKQLGDFERNNEFLIDYIPDDFFDNICDKGSEFFRTR